MRSIFLSLLVILAGVGALGWATAGFETFTSEQARRLAVARESVILPNVSLIGADGESRSLADLLGRDGRVTLVNFIYTRCNSLCIVMGNEFQQLQQQIADDGLADKVRLLSISFDPRRDAPEVLARYARWLQADPRLWQFATVNDPAELRDLLNAFGIVVIPDEFGGFQHNAAFHVVNPAGELTAIVDLTQPRRALAHAVREGSR